MNQILLPTYGFPVSYIIDLNQFCSRLHSHQSPHHHCLIRYSSASLSWGTWFQPSHWSGLLALSLERSPSSSWRSMRKDGMVWWFPKLILVNWYPYRYSPKIIQSECVFSEKYDEKHRETINLTGLSGLLFIETVTHDHVIPYPYWYKDILAQCVTMLHLGATYPHKFMLYFLQRRLSAWPSDFCITN